MFKKHFNTIVLGLVSFVCASMVYMAYSSVGAQKADKERMTTELAQLSSDIKQTKAAYNKAKNQLVDTTEFNADQEARDKSLIKKTLSPIFTWKSGAEYDSAREKLIAFLGPDSDLVQTYMPENIKVFVPDDLKDKIADNDVDLNGYKSKLSKITVYRTSWSGDGSASYDAIAEYQAYNKRSQLDKATTYKVLITVKATGDKDNRKLVDASARNLMEA